MYTGIHPSSPLFSIILTSLIPLTTEDATIYDITFSTKIIILANAPIENRLNTPKILASSLRNISLIIS